MKQLQHDRKYGELDQVLSAFLGQPADDTPEQPSAALQAYLRHTWHARPWAIGIAEHQLRDYAHNPPGRLKLKLGEYYPLPDVSIGEESVLDWLLVLADHLRASVDSGEVPAPGPPRTHWEWRARFPELAQLLGGWFSQDMSDEFTGHEAALADYLDTTDQHLIARAAGEVAELLALDLEESDYAVGLAELGLEMEPPAPYSPSGWLALLADRLGGPRAEYGPSRKAEYDS
ncbi:contact-dependent growth inhibition system immunity protein [Streptomyces qinglanensis]|uniref:contact-dependent growth inhibition system immunity protein n=1 Tax=Streptomyces qinglanensis TaxID=943816 RepID=UPI003D751892